MLAAACLILGGERKRATGKERKRREERKRKEEGRIGKGGREAKERLGDQNEKWAQIRDTHTVQQEIFARQKFLRFS